MEKLKPILKALLFPHTGLVGLLVIAAACGLVWVFTQGMENTLPAYAIYVGSFYALCTVIARIPGLVRRSRARVYAHPGAVRYLSQGDQRIRRSLYRSTALNLAFGAFKLGIGVYYRSFWFGAVGVYYMALSLMRYLLIRSDRAVRDRQDREALLHQWRGYRTCGALLLVVNATMSGIVFQTIWQSRGFVYPGYVIYASAAYAFYRLGLAIAQTLKQRRGNQPLFAAAKVTDLSVALMSIFALQTAMFAEFGGDMPPETQQLMNSLTGGGVCLAVVCLAVYMLHKSHRSIKQFHTETQEHETYEATP